MSVATLDVVIRLDEFLTDQSRRGQPQVTVEVDTTPPAVRGGGAGPDAAARTA
ncbi:MAG TPA: hypothetical protein VJM33_12885 [Microthrixaceae bacterium]|nr:hypothetical protein [Microthrixaceae bacterium]